MDKAKAAISGIINKAGHHDTTVHESVKPAVTQENIKPTEDERVTTAVDKEVHQDHYHTTVQPVQDRQVLPEQHHHKQTATEERRFDHNNKEAAEQTHAAEAAKYQNTQTTESVSHAQSVNPTVQGEHVHHHVHEQIQPVVQKETIQPHVVHKTVPVHEVHQNQAQHHGTTSLEPITMDQFQKTGGKVDQSQDRKYGFEGAPQHQPHANAASGVSGAQSASTGHTTETSQQSASLKDKINPKVDADGDGKAGFMK